MKQRLRNYSRRKGRGTVRQSQRSTASERVSYSPFAGSVLLKALLVSYLVTAVLLLILTMLLYKLELSEGKVTVGIVVSYVLSTFLGGLMAGRMLKTRKFLWGLVLGLCYFLLLLLISFGVYQGIHAGWQNALTTCVLCGAGGMLGGMIS